MGAIQRVARKFGVGGWGSGLKGYLQRERVWWGWVGGAKGLEGSHCKQTKGVPGNQELEPQSSLSSHVQLRPIRFFPIILSSIFL